MFDTMTMTKVIAALCGTLLIFLLGNWAASSLYAVESGGHGEQAHNAYPIETDEGHAEVEVDEGPSFADLLASADAAKGEKVFGKCKACHKLDEGANAVGPSLYGLVDRDIGSIGNFNYSSVLTELPGNWTGEALNEFLISPKTYAAGTKMTFSGLKKETDRANLIAYLGTIGG